MRPDANDLIELARDLFSHSKVVHTAKTIDDTRNKIVAAMAHMVPTGSLVLVPHAVDTAIEQETLVTSKN